MTAYSVAFTTAAAKELRKLDRPIRQRILDAVAKLESDPRPAGAVKLSGFTDAWRIRIGDYRVLYEVADGSVIVTVFRVGHRREVYDAI